MTTVSVGHVLVDERSLALLAVLLAVLNSGLDCENIHTIDLQSRNVLSTLVVLCKSSGAVRGSTHAVLVVCGGSVC